MQDFEEFVQAELWPWVEDKLQELLDLFDEDGCHIGAINFSRLLQELRRIIIADAPFYMLKDTSSQEHPAAASAAAGTPGRLGFSDHRIWESKLFTSDAFLQYAEKQRQEVAEAEAQHRLKGGEMQRAVQEAIKPLSEKLDRISDDFQRLVTTISQLVACQPADGGSNTLRDLLKACHAQQQSQQEEQQQQQEEEQQQHQQEHQQQEQHQQVQVGVVLPATVKSRDEALARLKAAGYNVPARRSLFGTNLKQVLNYWNEWRYGWTGYVPLSIVEGSM